MDQIIEFINEVIYILLSELLVVVVGVLVAHFLLSRWEKFRFGGWQVVISKAGRDLVRRPVSPRKAKEIQDEPEDLSVFLKGVVSPYEWINCDLYTTGQDLGLLTIDKPGRTYIINLDKNPPKKAP